MSASPAANPPKSILVVRLGAMGDVIHTMYAVTLLRCALPQTRIGWVVEERWSELLCAKGAHRSGPRSAGRPLVDFLHLVNTKSWRRSPLAGETRRQFSSALKEIREQQYEIAIDFQGAIKSALLARLSGVRTVFGMDRPRETPARLLYSQRVKTVGTHVIEQYRSLAQAFLTSSSNTKCDRTADSLSINVSFPGEAAGSEATPKLEDVSGPIILINPGAGWEAKQWPTDRYGEVARALANEHCSIFVNYGPGEEQLALALEQSSGGAARPITCALAELMALTRRASLFIGGDTGPLHLAAALGIPVVAIFGPTDPARNGPHSTNSIVIRNTASQTSLSHTETPDPGLLAVTPDEVLAAAHQLLERRRG